MCPNCSNLFGFPFALSYHILFRIHGLKHKENLQNEDCHCQQTTLATLSPSNPDSDQIIHCIDPSHS